MEINVSPRWSRLSCQLCTTLNGRLSVPRPTSPRHRCWDVKFQIGNSAVDFPRQESIQDSALQAAIEISFFSLFFVPLFSSFLSSPFQIFVYAFNRLCVEDQLNHIERALTGVINELAELFTSLKVKSKNNKKQTKTITEWIVRFSLSPTPPLPRLCFNYPTNYWVNRNSKLPEIVLFLFC